MARVPTYISGERVGGALPTGAGGPLATADAFGAAGAGAQVQEGADLQRLGAAVTQVGVTGAHLQQSLQEKQDKLDAANSVGKFSFSKTYYDIQKSTKDPREFAQNVGNAYSEQVDNYINGLHVTENARLLIKTALNGQRPSYIAQAEAYANKALDAKDRLDSNVALETQQNSVRADGTIEAYSMAVDKSNAIIDAQPNLTEIEKQAMRQQSAHTLGRRRFEQMISDASEDPVALQGIKNELQEGTFWKERLSSADYDRLLDSADSKMKAANSAEAAGGRAAIQSVKERNTNGVVIDPAELSAATAAANASKRPEIISQMAMINKQQEIYREGRGLPLAEMRAQREKAMKAQGIAGLPPVVQQGIAAGAQATNGTIGVEYLAGLVNAEYGHQVGSGDYGQPTGNRTPNGARGSDAIGIAQFTGKTFLDTVRKHSDALGVTPALSDTAILEMRKDPKFSLKAAALHALDNKAELEATLGRKVTDGDLYFAHFLGVAGAKRFLASADANPQALATANVAADQVAANRNVFFDGVRPRTNQQVRFYMANAMMNGPSRVDFAGAQAWQKLETETIKGLRDAPMEFARTVKRFADIGDISTPEGMAQRGVVAQQVAEYYGIPTRTFKPLTPTEVEQLSRTVRDGTADETIGVIGQVAQLGGDMARAAFKQLGEKDAVFAYAAGLATVAGQQGVAADILRGEKRVKEDKDVLTALGMHENDIIAEFSKTVGKAVIGTELGTQIRKAAVAHYIETSLARGSAKAGTLDKAGFEASVNAVLGGAAAPDGKAIGSVNGAQILLPRGVTAAQFDTALDRMTADDYSRLSKWGGPPLYSDGKVAGAKDIASEGRFEAIGNGEYRIKMGDGTYLLSGMATMPDGTSKRAVPFIFQGDPAAVQEFAARPLAASPLPPMVPGVAPARPRVVQ